MALALDKGAENPRGIAQDLEQLGILHQRQQSWDRAAGELDRAIRLYAAWAAWRKWRRYSGSSRRTERRAGCPSLLTCIEGCLCRPVRSGNRLSVSRGWGACGSGFP